MARRMNGEGSWGKKVVKGIEYYSFRKTYPEGRKEFTGKTKKEVEQKRKKYEQDKKVKATIKSKDYFADYVMDYVKNEASKNISPSTLEQYITAVEVRIKPEEYYIGQLQLEQLSAKALADYVESLVQKKYSRATIEKTMRIVRKAVKHGMKEGKIAKDVLDEFNVPSENYVITKEKEVPFLSKEDMDKIYDVAKNHERFETGNNRYVIILIMYTGLRIGEAQELRWKDVDFENKTIHVQRTAVRLNGKLVPKETPKTKAGKRVIPLCNQAMEAIEYFHQFNPTHTPEDLVCLSTKGTQVDHSKLRRTLLGILKLAECSVQKCGLHTLRHSFGSRLLEEGVDIKVVSLLLGHEKVSTTYDIYIHILNSRITKSVEIFNT